MVEEPYLKPSVYLKHKIGLTPELDPIFPQCRQGSVTHSSCIRIRGAGVDRNPCRSEHQAGIDAVHVQCHFMAAVARRSFAVHVHIGLVLVLGLGLGLGFGFGCECDCDCGGYEVGVEGVGVRGLRGSRGSRCSCSNRRGRRSHSRWMSNSWLALCVFCFGG